VPHELLLHFHRSPDLIKQRPKSVAEGVPTDASETAAKACRCDMELLLSLDKMTTDFEIDSLPRGL
jgi:hypothetical protein